MISGGKNGFAASADKALMYDGSNIFNSNNYSAKAPDDLQFTWNDKWFTLPYIGNHPIEKNGTFSILNDPFLAVPEPILSCEVE
tara:strand:- start:398 stop:649 length:252 start_codon:yes stop_codon:yes gene_type:complete